MNKAVLVTIEEDCDNAPKKLLLRDFNIASASGNTAFIANNITEDIVWRLFEPAGQKQIYGKNNVIKEFEQNLVIVPIEVVLETIITHGDKGAVAGIIKAESGKSYVFCDVYKFSSYAKNAQIKEMTSYIIEREAQ